MDLSREDREYILDKVVRMRSMLVRKASALQNYEDTIKANPSDDDLGVLRLHMNDVVEMATNLAQLYNDHDVVRLAIRMPKKG